MTIVLTATVAPDATPLVELTHTVSIASATPELETADNVVEGATLVGRRTLLPLIFRQ